MYLNVMYISIYLLYKDALKWKYTKEYHCTNIAFKHVVETPVKLNRTQISVVNIVASPFLLLLCSTLAVLTVV